MALGNQNALYRLIAGNVDLVAEFRVPARYLLLAYFPLAAAAALGTDALLGRDLGRLGARARQGLGGLAVVGLVLGFALLVGGHSDWVESRRWWVPGRGGRGAGLAGGGFLGRAQGRWSPWSCWASTGVRAAAGPPGGRVPPARPRRRLRRPGPGDGAAGPRARPLRDDRLGAGRPRPRSAARSPPWPATTARMRRLLPGGVAAAAGRPAGLGVRHQRRDHLRPRRRAAAAPHLPGVLRRRGQPGGPPDRRGHRPRRRPSGAGRPWTCSGCAGSSPTGCPRPRSR